MSSISRLPRTGAFTVLLLLVGVLLLTSAHAQDGSDEPDSGLESLQAAYQREFIFLNNEIRVLEGRLSEVNENGERRVAAARNELEKLESRLLSLRNEVEQRQQELSVLQEESGDTRSTDDVVEQVVEQGQSRLETFDVKPFQSNAEGSERREEELRYVIDSSFQVLQRNSRIYTETGSFFLEDGTTTEGEMVHIGRIAAFGVGSDDAGTLAPAGDGMLRLVERETADVARELALDEGVGKVAQLPLFLFESLQELVEIEEGQSFADTVEAAGIIGLVILAIGALALVLIIARIAILILVGRGSRSAPSAVAGSVRKGDLEAASRKSTAVPGGMGRVLASTVHGLQHNAQGIEDVISEAVLNEQPKLDRFRTVLGVFAAVAPLLGLLGTVTGMITTFDVITQFGTGDPKLLSGGISEALITTEFGLAVAIPTLLVGNLLSSWSDRITSSMEISALRLVNLANDASTTDSTVASGDETA